MRSNPSVSSHKQSQPLKMPRHKRNRKNNDENDPEIEEIPSASANTSHTSSDKSVSANSLFTALLTVQCDSKAD